MRAVRFVNSLFGLLVAASQSLAATAGVLCGSIARAAEPPLPEHAESVVLRPMWATWPTGTPRLVISTDTRIGDARVSYKDPEFDVASELMVWQDGQEQVWLCRFDPRTGDLIPRDGRDRFVGQGSPYLPQGKSPPTDFLKTVVNGPEFGLSQRGLGIYFCTGDDPENYQLARWGLSDQTLEILAPEPTNGVRGAFASSDPQDEVGRVLCGRLERQPDGTLQVATYWFEENDPDNVQPFSRSTFGTTGPRWIPGQRAIVSNLYDEAGIPQIVRYDIDTQQTTFLTSGPNSKIDAIFFETPEFPGEQLFLCLVDNRWIDVYRRQGPGWTAIRRIAAPNAESFDTPPSTLSAEPVVYRGQTYFTYAVGYADNSSRIALASLDGQVNTLVSTAGQTRQLDPEGVAVGDQLFVYYWTLANGQSVNELHRCKVQFWP
ncbi:MAG: hypothetical protein SH850_29315 [Planctomycetaceae bacterium]|nr:hypothetical protein [Planctomycetaceae bacterium]